MKNCPITGQAHVAIRTEKMEDTLRFYTKVFPFTLLKAAYDAPDGAKPGTVNQAILRCGDLYLELLRADEATGHGGKPGPLHHLGISVANLEDALAFLEVRGLPESAHTAPAQKTNLDPAHPYRSASVTGPNGEILGLYEIDNASYFG